MKLRLIQKHYENFTGHMGITHFVDGLSVDDVLPNTAGRMSAVIQCEWEDGSPANVGHIYLDNMHTPAPIASEIRAGEEAAAQNAEQEVKSANAGLPVYTEEQLGLIADESGIAGLRAIADTQGIKSNSIGGLIEAIVKAGVPVAAE